MSNDSKVFVKKLAEETLKMLTEKLVNKTLDSKLTPEQKKEKVQEIIREIILQAYKQAGSDNRSALKRQLSLLLHPDRLGNNDKLGAYLQQANLLDAPQNILMTFFEQFEYDDGFWKSLLDNPSEIMIILQKRALDNPLWNNIKRYPPPFNWLAIGVTVAAAVILVFAVIMASVFLGVVNYSVKAANFIVNMMLNILTNDYYHELTEKYKTDNFNASKAAFIKSVRIILQTDVAKMMEDMTDDEVLNYLANAEASQSGATVESILKKYHQAIKDSTPIEGQNRFKMFFTAVYLTTTQPINEIKGNKFFNLVIVRPLLVIAAPILFSAVAVGELAKFTIKSAQLAATGLALATYYLTLMFLNIPIAIYDFFVSLANKMSFSTGEDVGKRNSMAPLMITYDLEKTATAEKTDEKEPGNFGSPIHYKPVVTTPNVVHPVIDLTATVSDTISQPGF